MAEHSTNQLARIHALWTMEGLGALDASLVRTMLKDADPKIRIQAIRASETLYKGGDTSFADDYRALTKDADPNVVIQAMLTLNLHKVPGAEALIRTTAAASAARGVREIGAQIVKPKPSLGQRPSLADTGAGNVNLSTADRRVLRRGESTYRELCFSCHGADGQGAPMAGTTDGTTLAPPLAGSPRVQGHRDYVINVILDGLTGPIEGKTYGGGAVMVPMGANTDEWIADVASFVRNSFGNSGMLVTPADVARVRKASTRTTPWTLPELEAAVPAELANSSLWKLTASDNAAAAANAIGTNATARWDTGAPQRPGMWFQIELPEPTRVAELQLDSSVAGVRLFGRGMIQAGPPAGYRVQVSTDGSAWSDPVATGTGTAPTTVITFAPVEARFIRITQTSAAGTTQGWAIQRLRVYRAGQ